jgi:hypothetical protein
MTFRYYAGGPYTLNQALQRTPTHEYVWISSWLPFSSSIPTFCALSFTLMKLMSDTILTLFLSIWFQMEHATIRGQRFHPASSRRAFPLQFLRLPGLISHQMIIQCMFCDWLSLF